MLRALGAFNALGCAARTSEGVPLAALCDVGGGAASALWAEAGLAGAERVDEAPANEAEREAIANALTNASRFDRRGIVCVWRNEAITVENPGDFRMLWKRRGSRASPTRATRLS